jgi:hypothetical protein
MACDNKARTASLRVGKACAYTAKGHMHNEHKAKAWLIIGYLLVWHDESWANKLRDNLHPHAARATQRCTARNVFAAVAC